MRETDPLSPPDRTRPLRTVTATDEETRGKDCILETYKLTASVRSLADSSWMCKDER